MKKILALILLVATVYVSVDFYRFPEKYITTWKYQLENRIKRGDQEAMEYYKRTYIQHGENLFE